MGKIGLIILLSLAALVTTGASFILLALAGSVVVFKLSAPDYATVGGAGDIGVIAILFSSPILFPIYLAVSVILGVFTWRVLSKLLRGRTKSVGQIPR